MPEQDTTRKGRVYEIYTRYEEYEVEGIWDSTVFAKELEAGRKPPRYNRRSTWKPALAVRPLEAEQRLYPDQPTTTSPPTAHNGSSYLSYNYSWHAQLSTITTWMKGCQLSTIWIQWRPKWKIVSYRRYGYNDDLSERLSVINDTSTTTTWMKGYQLLTIRVWSQSESRVASYQWYKCENDFCGCLLNQRHAKPCYQTLIVASFIQTLKIRSFTCLTKAWIQAFKKRLLADQRFSSWWWWSERDFLTFYKRKPLRGATSEVVRETAGQMRLSLTLETSTSNSTIYHTTWWVEVTAK